MAGERLNRRDLARRAAALGLAGGAAGMPRRGARAGQAGGGTVRVAVVGGGNPPGGGAPGNPVLTGAAGFLGHWAFSRLVRADDRGAPVPMPDLADAWEEDADGAELTFRLNPAATWHDGRPVTSADVLASFALVGDPATPTDLRADLTVDGVLLVPSAPDPRTVVLTAPRRHAPLLAALARLPILPAHLFAPAAGAGTGPVGAAPVGSGPFRVTAWAPGGVSRYARYAGHHRGQAAAEALEEIAYPDHAAALAALAAGEVDLAFAPAGYQATLEGRADVALRRYVYPVPVALGFNFKHPVVAVGRFREAVRWAVDKDALVARLPGGRGGRAVRADNQFAFGGPFGRYNDQLLPPDGHDPARAGQLLDGIGYPRGADGVRAGAAGRLVFPLLYPAGFPEHEAGAAVLREQLGAVGIEIEPRAVPWGALAARRADPAEDPAGRPLTLEEWPHPAEPDADLRAELHSASFPPNGRNHNYVADRELDRLIDEGQAERDDGGRIARYRLLDNRRRTVIPTVPLWETTDAWAVSERVGGIPLDTPDARWFLRCCMERVYRRG